MNRILRIFPPTQVRQTFVSSTRTKTSCSVESLPEANGWTDITIPVPWGHIAGKTYGDPKGKPVLAVHGVSDNSGTFDRLVPLLPKSLYVVAIDLPGHGRSSHNPSGVAYHYIDAVIALRRVTNYLEWTKFSWLGHSLGAGLGAVFSSVFPSHKNRAKILEGQADKKISSLKAAAASEEPFVERLIMIDLVIPVSGVEGSNFTTKISLGIDGFLALEEKQLKTGPPAYDLMEIEQRLIKGTANALDSETARIMMIRGVRKLDNGKYTFSRDIAASKPTTLILGFSHEKLFEILSEIRSPLLFIKAKNSTWYFKPEIYKRALEVYRKSSSNFQYEEIEGDHFLHLNTPERIAETVSKFLVTGS